MTRISANSSGSNFNAPGPKTTGPRGRISDRWLLATLLFLFLIIAFIAETYGVTVTDQNSTSTLNAHANGTKALFTLFDTLHYPVDRLSEPWRALTNQDGLLIVVEPFDKDRQVDSMEMGRLKTWVSEGGTLLYCVSPPTRPIDAKDPLAGDTAVVFANENIKNENIINKNVKNENVKNENVKNESLNSTDNNSNKDVKSTDGRDNKSDEDNNNNDNPETVVEPTLPITDSRAATIVAKVEHLSIRSAVRLRPLPDAPYTVLFRDRQGAIALHKTVGKGQIILVADTYFLSNAGIKQSDNVLFIANIAGVGCSQARPNLRFDEYHHGFGADANRESDDILSTLPLNVKRGGIALSIFLLVLVYNSARRFGAPIPVPTTHFRPSTDYLSSLARWYRRAEASDLALKTLYTDFKRHLTLRLEIAPDTPIGMEDRDQDQEWARRIKRLYPDLAEQMLPILWRCESLTSAPSSQTITNEEFLAIATKLEQFRRSLYVAGNR